jgi:uncharacterized membrane protein YgdD (TMEM256/DUF423 family)
LVVQGPDYNPYGSKKMARILILLGALNGFVAVALGAYASHGLRDRLGSDMLDAFQIGVDYQALHALALLATGLLMLHIPGSRWGRLSGWLFLLGIVLFSGSLYALVLIGRPGLGVITPIGGMTLLAGWLALAIAGFKDVPRAG